MGRRSAAPKRDFAPDPVYNDIMVTRFINGLMLQGKKQLAEKTFYSAMDIIEKKTGEKGIDLFKKAMENIKPVLEVKSRRIGGATYQVPMEVRPARVDSLAIKWLVKFARAGKEKGMENKLAKEIIDASNSEGGAVRKKEEVHKIAESNKAFAHYKF